MDQGFIPFFPTISKTAKNKKLVEDKHARSRSTSRRLTRLLKHDKHLQSQCGPTISKTAKNKQLVDNKHTRSRSTSRRLTRLLKHDKHLQSQCGPVFSHNWLIPVNASIQASKKTGFMSSQEQEIGWLKISTPGVAPRAEGSLAYLSSTTTCFMGRRSEASAAGCKERDLKQRTASNGIRSTSRRLGCSLTYK